MARNHPVKTFVVTVNATATLVVPADIETRTVYLHNASGGSIYLGGSDVTAATGYHLQNNAYASFVVPGNETIYGIVSTGTRDVFVFRSADA